MTNYKLNDADMLSLKSDIADLENAGFKCKIKEYKSEQYDFITDCVSIEYKGYCVGNWNSCVEKNIETLKYALLSMKLILDLETGESK